MNATKSNAETDADYIEATTATGQPVRLKFGQRRAIQARDAIVAASIPDADREFYAWLIERRLQIAETEAEWLIKDCAGGVINDLCDDRFEVVSLADYAEHVALNWIDGGRALKFALVAHTL